MNDRCATNIGYPFAMVVVTRVPDRTPTTLRLLLTVHEEVVHATIEIHNEPNA